jgi:hypothetical protein
VERIPAPSGTRLAAAVVAVIVAGSATAGVFLFQAKQPPRATPADAIVETVGLSSTTTTVDVTVLATLQTSPDALAGASPDGVVTSLGDIQVGGTVINGATVYEVDGTAVRAVRAPRPFYRTIKLGDHGWDVDELRGVLRTLKISVPASGPADAQLQASVRGWAGGSQDLAGDVVFDPGLTVWIPAGPDLRVSKIAVQAGAPSPARGTAVVSFAPSLQSAELKNAPPADGFIVDRTVSVAGMTYRLNGAQLKLDDAGRVALAAAASNSGTQPGALAEQATTLELDGRLQTTWSSASSLPIVAIVTRATGELCVVSRTSAGYQPANVTVAASSTADGTAVVSGLLAGVDVVLNPVDAGLDDICR